MTGSRFEPSKAGRADIISIRVYGRPAPQGSKRYLGAGRMIESSRYVGQWRQDVIASIMPAHRQHLAAPVQLSIVFFLRRPKKRKSGEWHGVRPDLSKLIRATEDALVDAGVLTDDCFISVLCAAKVYHDEPGAHITVRLITE